MRLMMRNFFTCLFLVLALPSLTQAATWIKLNENSQLKLMLDKQSIVQKDQLTRAWVKIEYKSPQINVDSADKTYNLSKLLWYFDCSAQKTATSQVFQYMDTEAVYSAAIDIKSAEFIEPMTESDLDVAMRYVCSSRKPIKLEVAANTAIVPKKAVVNKKVDVAKADTAKGVDASKEVVSKEEATKDVTKEAEKKLETSKTQATQAEVKKAAVEAKPQAVVAAETKQEETIISPIKNIKPTFGKQTKSAVEWSYEGKNGPDQWAKISPNNALCMSGKNQSPIDISITADASLKVLKGIQKMPIKEVLLTDNAMQANVKEGNMILLDDVAYQMKNIQFHLPSEHLVKGKGFPIESHLVHADSKGNIMIMAVFYKEGKVNTSLDKLLKQLPKALDTPALMQEKLKASEFIPDNHDYYRVTGSLTRPPCAEGVRWVIYKTPLTASKEQIAMLEQALKQPNNRPVQALNGRIVVE